MCSYLPAKPRDEVLVRLAACCVGQYGVFVFLALSYIKYSYFVSLSAEREEKAHVQKQTLSSLSLIQAFCQRFLLSMLILYMRHTSGISVINLFHLIPTTLCVSAATLKDIYTVRTRKITLSIRAQCLHIEAEKKYTHYFFYI